MKHYFVIYRPFLVFLGTFFLVYIILTIGYQVFLSSFPENKVDSITKFVSDNTEFFLKIINTDFNVQTNLNMSHSAIFFKEKLLAIIIEGCNAMSVIILFISFVAAFSGECKTTLLYILGGSLLIYGLNIFRIVAFTLLLLNFSTYKELLHDIVFPLFIYGVVFILWVVWVNKFSKYAKKNIGS